MSTSNGIDVSTHQKAQDWQRRRWEGLHFAFAKASEGERSRDDMFDEHMSGILKAGLVAGAYHFAWPNQSAVAEAANYIGAVKPYASSQPLVHWLDLERYTDGRNYRGRTDRQIREWAELWVASVKRAFPGQRVGVYTSRDDVQRGHLPANVPFWYPQYPWSSTPASYPKAAAYERPKVDGHLPLFWQFTSTPLDRNICYLSPGDLRNWSAGTSGTEGPTMTLTTADLAKIYETVWETDEIAAPPGQHDAKTNKTWQAQSYLKDTNRRVRHLESLLAAQNVVIKELSAALATNRDTSVDSDALVERIERGLLALKAALADDEPAPAVAA